MFPNTHLSKTGCGCYTSIQLISQESQRALPLTLKNGSERLEGKEQQEASVCAISEEQGLSQEPNKYFPTQFYDVQMVILEVGMENNGSKSRLPNLPRVSELASHTASPLMQVCLALLHRAGGLKEQLKAFWMETSGWR